MRSPQRTLHCPSDGICITLSLSSIETVFFCFQHSLKRWPMCRSCSPIINPSIHANSSFFLCLVLAFAFAFAFASHSASVGAFAFASSSASAGAFAFAPVPCSVHCADLHCSWISDLPSRRFACSRERSVLFSRSIGPRDLPPCERVRRAPAMSEGTSHQCRNFDVLDCRWMCRFHVVIDEQVKAPKFGVDFFKSSLILHERMVSSVPNAPRQMYSHLGHNCLQASKRSDHRNIIPIAPQQLLTML